MNVRVEIVAANEWNHGPFLRVDNRFWFPSAPWRHRKVSPVLKRNENVRVGKEAMREISTGGKCVWTECVSTDCASTEWVSTECVGCNTIANTRLGWNRFVGVRRNVVGADYVSQRMKYKLEMRNEEMETNIPFNLVI